MPPKLQVEEAFVFLFQCIEASGCKMDFKGIGQATGLSHAAARMRYTRLKKAVDSGQFRGAAMHQPPAALLQNSNSVMSTKSTEPIVDEDSDLDENYMALTRKTSRKRKPILDEIVSEAGEYEQKSRVITSKRTKLDCELNEGNNRNELGGKTLELLPFHDEGTSIGRDGMCVLGGRSKTSTTSGHAFGTDINNEQSLVPSNEYQDNLGKAREATFVHPSKAAGRKASSGKAAEAAYARAYVAGSSNWTYGNLEAGGSIRNEQSPLTPDRHDGTVHTISPPGSGGVFLPFSTNKGPTGCSQFEEGFTHHEQTNLDDRRTPEELITSRSSISTTNLTRNGNNHRRHESEGMRRGGNAGKTALDVLGLEDGTRNENGSALQRLTSFWTK